MLNRVVIKNYRCLRDIDVPLKPLTVLIGPNNTGKTTALSAIQTLGAEKGKERSVESSDYWRLDRSARPTITGYTNGNEELFAETAPGTSGAKWNWKGDRSSISPVTFFKNSIFIPAMESAGADGKSIPRIDENAANLPAFLDALLRKDRDRFFSILETLKRLIPGLTDLNIETPSAQNRRIDLQFEDGFVVDAKRASTGVKLLIFFVCLANHPDPPRTILLEEPETGVHPKRLEDIVNLLRDLTEGVFAAQATQVIVSSHSPHLLDCIDPIKHQVLVFQRASDGGCTATPVDSDRLRLFLDEFMLGEVWLNQEEEGLLKKEGQ